MPSRLTPRSARRADLLPGLTYAHTDRGPCYVWAPDPPQQYTTWMWSYPEPMTLSVCGVQVSLEARPESLGTTDDRVPVYGFFGWYNAEGQREGLLTGTVWGSEQDNWDHLQYLSPRILFAQQADPIYVHFTPAVNEVRVLWACSSRSGNILIAYDSLGAVLTQVPVPTYTADQAYINDCLESHPTTETVVAAPGIRTLKMQPAPGSGRPSSRFDQAAQSDPMQNLMFAEITKIVPESRIHVACTPSNPFRKSQVACTATATGALSVTGWTFIADDFVDTVLVQTQAVQWAGPLVTQGRITVRGNVDGVSATADTVRVTVRDLPGDSLPTDTAHISDDPSSCLYSYRVFAAPGAGQTAIPGLCTKNPAMFPLPDAGEVPIPFDIRRVMQGPNTGVWYVDSLKAKLRVRSEVLADLLLGNGAYPYWMRADVDTVVTTACWHYLGHPGKPQRTTVIAFKVYETNVNCLGNTEHTAFINYTSRHEGCHMARPAAFYKDSTLAKTLIGQIRNVNGRDSLSVLQLARSRALTLRNTAASISLEIDGVNPTPHSYHIWLPTSLNGGWLLRTVWDSTAGIFPASLCH